MLIRYPDIQGLRGEGQIVAQRLPASEWSTMLFAAFHGAPRTLQNTAQNVLSMLAIFPRLSLIL